MSPHPETQYLGRYQMGQQGSDSAEGSVSRTNPCRRRFLEILGGGLLWSVGVGCVQVRRHVVRVGKAPRVWVSLADVSKLQKESDVIELRVAGEGKPIVVRQVSPGSYVALLSECTHRSCEVEPSPFSYDCPCHGSRFDLQGKVLEGPADAPLRRFGVQKTSKGLWISLS